MLITNDTHTLIHSCSSERITEVVRISFINLHNFTILRHQSSVVSEAVPITSNKVPFTDVIIAYFITQQGCSDSSRITGEGYFSMFL